MLSTVTVFRSSNRWHTWQSHFNSTALMCMLSINYYSDKFWTTENAVISTLSVIYTQITHHDAETRLINDTEVFKIIDWLHCNGIVAVRWLISDSHCRLHGFNDTAAGSWIWRQWRLTWTNVALFQFIRNIHRVTIHVGCLHLWRWLYKTPYFKDWVQTTTITIESFYDILQRDPKSRQLISQKSISPCHSPVKPAINLLHFIWSIASHSMWSNAETWNFVL